MLKIICDCCGKDAKLCAYDVRVNLLHNPVPAEHFGSFDEPKVTSDPRRMRFTLCSNCYRRLSLPNIYQATEEKTVKFRDKPPAGKWLRRHGQYATCSACGITQTVNVLPGGKIAFNYCPYCGLPMEGGGQDE